jgi:hypothetical protein
MQDFYKKNTIAAVMSRNNIFLPQLMPKLLKNRWQNCSLAQQR